MKKYFVLDWYDDWNDPEFIGEFDTVKEAEEACDNWEAETDGECDCIIYTTAITQERQPKIYQMAMRRKREG